MLSAAAAPPLRRHLRGAARGGDPPRPGPRWTSAPAAPPGALVARGIRPGDRVAIVLRTEPAFLDAFFGALARGRRSGAPLPAGAARAHGRVRRGDRAHAAGLGGPRARHVGERGPGDRPGGGGGRPGARPRRGLDAAGLLEGTDTAVARSGSELALVQFSSGSTVDPKPVALSQASLGAQVDALVALIAPSRRRRPRVLAAALPRHGAHRLPARRGELPGAARAPGARALPGPAGPLAARGWPATAAPSRRRPTSPTPTPPTGCAMPTSRGSRSPPGASRSTAPSRSPRARWSASPRASPPSASIPAPSCRSTASPRRHSQ